MLRKFVWFGMLLDKIKMNDQTLPRSAKRMIAMGVDLVICVTMVWVAYYLRLGEFISFTGKTEWAQGALWATLLAAVISMPVFLFMGVYQVIFRHGFLHSLGTLVRGTIIYGLLYSGVITIVGIPGVPRTIGIIQPILLLLGLSVSRALVGSLFEVESISRVQSRVMIYGAGVAGRQLASAMAIGGQLKVVGFVDDNPNLHSRSVNGLNIYNPADLHKLVAFMKVTDVLLAMPSISRKRRAEIIDSIRGTHVFVRTLPSLIELAKGNVTISDIRELDINDLLGRDPVAPNPSLMARNIAGKVVMVTGAGGSIGSELCRQIIQVRPAKLLLLEQNEFSLYAIHQELESRLPESEVVLLPLLASIQDKPRLREIMTTWRPDTVYHAAAHKHVPLVEHNVSEGIVNNVMGTLRMVEVALESGVSSFVLISTDKAVRPTNVMGASKRLAELILQAFAAKPSGTKFCMVRFGNVLGSSGSVVPKFRQQIREGGPITLTHPEIIRYFMTIPEAAQLVIQAGSLAEGGDVFLLDMGEPIKIIDLAQRMVELSGLTLKDTQNPDGDIEILISGLRPGEKLYEELLIGGSPEPTSHSRIMKAHEGFVPWAELENSLSALEIAAAINDVYAIRSIISKLVPEYAPDAEIADWIFVAASAEALASTNILEKELAAKCSIIK